MALLLLQIVKDDGEAGQWLVTAQPEQNDEFHKYKLLSTKDGWWAWWHFLRLVVVVMVMLPLHADTDKPYGIGLWKWAAAARDRQRDRQTVGEERKRVGRTEMKKISDRRRRNSNDIQT
ncbi:unnamed protein product [Sphagnum jensenii]|uniref:Uncharacterized protein n=1 Tax=Sphagnum jensenii TaxID=128206 RepID=A0ABP0XBE0_9BRYO